MLRKVRRVVFSRWLLILVGFTAVAPAPPAASTAAAVAGIITIAGSKGG